MRAAVPLRQSKGDKRLVSKGLPLLLLPLLVISGISLTTIIAPSVQATSGVVKDMTFLLHSVNATETAKPLPGGGSTLTYFDTTLDFNDVNVSVLVEGTQKVLQWFLVPDLAGDFGVEGFTLRIWSNSSTAASSNAQVTVEIHELNETSSTLVHSENFGSQTFPVTPTLMAWTAFLAAPHAFSPGSSIELRLTVNPGAMQGVWFHYDTAQVNSRVSLSGPDSLDVAGVPALDSDRNVSLRFDPDAANKTIYIQARVTDPLGGYDIRWINLTLVSPFDTVLLDNASMARVSGTPLSYESVFEVEWNYTNQATGEYRAHVWALDNNGHNYYSFFQQFDFADYPDIANSAFFIGGLPVYVNVQAVDSTGVPLPGARVALMSSGFPVEEKMTDLNGMANLTMNEGSFEFQAFWEDVQVVSMIQNVQSNVSASDPLVLVTQVYYPIFQAETAGGVALPGASLLFVHPNGDTLGPYKTNENGQVVLSQAPLGSYEFSVSWRGIDVFAGSANVMNNGMIPFSTAVYELTVTTESGLGEPLAGVFVSVTDSTGLVFDAGVTGADGTVVLLLPEGGYTVQSRYVTTHMGSLYDSGLVSTSLDLSGSTSVAVTFSDFPPSLTNTLVFLFGLVYAATIAALVVAFLILRRRKAKGEALFSAGEEP